MKNILFLIFFPVLIFSQNSVVVDSLSNEPLSYATIIFDNGSKGVYSNEDGSFNIDKGVEFIEVSYMGYISKKIPIKSLTSIIKLQRSIELLNEVIIKPRTQRKEISFLKSPNVFGNCILKPESEIISVVKPNSEIISMKIDKLSFSFHKLKWSKNKEVLKEEVAVIRINIYDLKNDLPNDLIYSSTPIKINAYEKAQIVVNIENELIIFDKNGLAFSIEYVGNINAEGQLYKTSKLFLRPELAENKSKYFSGHIYQKFQLTQSKNNLIDLIADWNKTFSEKEKISERTLNIKFELSN